MELQFEKTAVPVLNTALQEIRNLELTHEVKLSDGMPDIGRVLTSWGQILLRSKEWNRDEISVSGGVMIWTLYLPEDGTEPRSVESWVPFQMSWDIGAETREGAICMIPLLRFVDGRGTSSRKMMLRAGISALAKAYSPSEREIFRPGEVPEDVQLLNRTYPVRVPKEAGEKVFLLDEELSLPESQPGIEKLISYVLKPDVGERRIVGNRFVFKGNGNLHLVYRCPEGKIRTWDFELPFSQFAELDDRYSDEAKGDIHLAVTSLEMDLPDSGKLRVKAGMVGQYLVDDQLLLELTEDAYSPIREVEPMRESLPIPSVLDERTEYVTAVQSVPGLSGQSADVNFLPDFPKQRKNGELELPGLFQVLSYGEGGSLQSTNARWEGKTGYATEEHTSVQAVPQIVGQPEGIPGSDGMNLGARMRLWLRTDAETELPMVTGLSLGERQEPEPGRPSLVLCRAGDADLWTIAKRNGSTVKAIMEANGLETEPEESRMLLIPIS